MEIQNGGDFGESPSEKSKREKFIKRQEKKEKARFEEKNDEEFAKEDVEDALKPGNDVENDREQQAADAYLLDEPRGVNELDYLKQKQGTKDSVVIDDNTVFSDGGKADGSYVDDREFELPDEMRRQIEEAYDLVEKEGEENAKELKKIKEFHGDRGSMGKRGRGRHIIGK